VFVSKDARVVRRKKARLVHGKEEALNADNAVEGIVVNGQGQVQKNVRRGAAAIGNSPPRRVTRVNLEFDAFDGDKDNCDLYQCTWDEVLKKCDDGKGDVSLSKLISYSSFFRLFSSGLLSTQSFLSRLSAFSYFSRAT
jgi:hypothetical protein